MTRLLFCLAMLLCAPVAAAQTPAQRIDAVLAAQNDEPVINGGVLAAMNGRTVYADVQGYADFSARRPLRLDDVFQTASLAKPFTAVAVLQLRDRGLLGLDDRVSEYVEGIPFDTITIRHLLTHTSGLPDIEIFEPMVAADPQRIIGADDLLPALRAPTTALAFAPGERFQYSNINYQLLALIVARVSGQSFADYMRVNVFTPARMRHSYVLGGRPIARTRAAITNQSYATMYSAAPQDVRSINVGDERRMHRLRYETYNLGSTLGDQNVFTTLGDLERFDDALRSGRLLSFASQAEMYAPALLNDGSSYQESEVYIVYGVACSYGMGWETCAHPVYGRLVGHAGFNRGIATMFYRNLDRGQMIAMFDNAETSDFAQKFASVANALNGDPPVAFSRQRSLSRAYGRMLVSDGAIAARAFFDAHRNDTETWAFTPRGLNQLGYDLLRNGHPDLALAPFRLNAELNPDHAGFQDSLGEGLGANGLTEEAIAAYQRALALDPNLQSARAALERLTAARTQ